MKYAEKLKDPRWQKKRLEVFNRDGFKCCHCYADDKTLHVHHLIYLPGKEPWDYDMDCFLTLCYECHEYLESRQADQCDDLLRHFKLRLKDTFIRDCAVAIFTETENLHDLIYVLFECVGHKKNNREEDAINELTRIFREQVDIDLAKHNETKINK